MRSNQRGTLRGLAVLSHLAVSDAGGKGGASEGATPTPTSEHEDDNSLGYTGTACSLPTLRLTWWRST
ncbi:hypothetical protein AAFF_G00371680 [Aldrovandia affinis]|uniref:Secreted protein n=1 Tax=Aldrovandia affinis TaxID=143900 RepID=A0AAD7SH71_9TELE|nr:hypothetical protein AAFF_G00371680 [Aldrovandia affinis]